jgi:hypothetical protein
MISKAPNKCVVTKDCRDFKIGEIFEYEDIREMFGNKYYVCRTGGCFVKYLQIEYAESLRIHKLRQL